MKTIAKILKKNPVYLNRWSNKEQVVCDFENSSIDNVNILFASYGNKNYEGEAFVLFEQDGKLYEVNGSHCSCYGLEGQWRPEETSVPKLQHRLVKGTMGDNDYCGNEYANELKEFLGL